MRFAKTLSREEMKNIKGGSYSCTCYSGSFGGSESPEELGSVTCSDDMEQQTCCQAHYEDTTATMCEA